MVNVIIITKLEQRNKELLEENEKLKKQLADKDNFKLRIWNAVHNLTESSEYTDTVLRTLERAQIMKRLLVLLIKKKKRIRNKDRRVRGWSGNGARRSWKGTGCSYEVKKTSNVWNSVKAQCCNGQAYRSNEVIGK